MSKFALASLVPLAVISLLLGQFFEGHIRDRTFAASQRAAFVVAMTVRSQLSPSTLDPGRSATSETAVARLDRLFESVKRAGVARARISDAHGEITYSLDHDQIGNHFAFTRELAEAIGGRATARLVDPGKNEYDERLETYTPIFGRHGEIVGVLQLDFHFVALAKAIDRDTKTMYVLLGGGFALLYALLLPIVGGASRRLRRQAEDNRYLALHDHLTGLPNRLLFGDRLEHAIRGAKRNGETAAVLLMDIDRFKEVNDTLGHQAGDALLEALAARLKSLVRDSDTIARLGGDEFALLLANVSDTGVVEIVGRIQSLFAEPFSLEGVPLEIEASIGIALYPLHGEDGESLLRRADVAMYIAKRTKSRYAFYDLDQDDYNPQRLALVGQLRRALEQRELVVHYQPKGSLPEGRVECVEALVRWEHPTRGLLGPSEFLPVAQNTGLIDSLTAYVLEEALTQCRTWRRRGHPVSVSVNVATRNLLDLAFPAFVRDLLESLELEPEALELEITETSVLTDPKRATQVLRELRDVGVRLVVDDFGTGYSSFTYLSQLPVDKIKIDKSFVLVMSEDEQGAAIVRSTIDVARNLSLKVVAEGVETEEVWARLSQLGCDSAQGFYLSRPLPVGELVKWLERTQERRDERGDERHLRALPAA